MPNNHDIDWALEEYLETPPELRPRRVSDRLPDAVFMADHREAGEVEWPDPRMQAEWEAEQR